MFSIFGKPLLFSHAWDTGAVHRTTVRIRLCLRCVFWLPQEGVQSRPAGRSKGHGPVSGLASMSSTGVIRTVNLNPKTSTLVPVCRAYAWMGARGQRGGACSNVWACTADLAWSAAAAGSEGLPLSMQGTENGEAGKKGCGSIWGCCRQVRSLLGPLAIP